MDSRQHHGGIGCGTANRVRPHTWMPASSLSLDNVSGRVALSPTPAATGRRPTRRRLPINRVTDGQHHWHRAATRSSSATGPPTPITGGGGNDNINAGDGGDTISGGTGNDIILAGTGNDTINWNANAAGDTDGFDMINGEARRLTDTFVVNGSASRGRDVPHLRQGGSARRGV